MASPLVWLRTIRHVRPAMIAARFGDVLKRKIRSAFPSLAAGRLKRAGDSAPPVGLQSFAGFYTQDRAGKEQASHFDFAAETFDILGSEFHFGPDPDWSGKNLSRHGRYVLHSFPQLESLAAAAHGGRRETACAVFRRLAETWIEANRVPSGDAWDSYPLSLRVVNWLKFAAQFERELEEGRDFMRLLGVSLYGQGVHLEKNLEWHLRLNHLFKNAKALLFLGHAFADERPERWRKLATRILTQAVKEQFFDDGCHVERSPMYHMTTVEDLCDCIELLRARGEKPPESWVETLSRASAFARLVLHPDGRIPLINDSSLEESREPEVVLRRAEAIPGAVPAAATLRDSSFAVVRTDDVFLIVDGGVPSPAYNPGHSHAGALSYELSIRGARAVVDTGVGEYAAGEIRDYGRSTRAHNTVCTDGGNQSEMWGSFRVGGRAVSSLSAAPDEGTGPVRISGECRWFGRRVRHSRQWIVIPGKGVLVLDSVRCAVGALVESLVHIAPGWEVERSGENAWTCSRGDNAFAIASLQSWRGRTEPCRVWRQFGREEASTLVAFQHEGPLDAGAYFIGLERLQEFEFRGSDRALVLDGEVHRW